jgi:hypothetical protein
MNIPNYQYWTNRDLWEAWQAVQLLLKQQPGLEPESGLGRYIPGPRTFREEYRARMVMVTDALDLGTLRPCHETEDYRPHEFRRLRPKEFLKWAQGKGWEIPKEFADILDSPDPESEQPDSVEESLDPRERATFLKIIAVLAREADLDLTKPYPAADTLIKHAARYGIEVPTTNTIAGKLQEVQQFLESQ